MGGRDSRWRDGTRGSFTYQGHSTLLAFGHLYVSKKVGRVTGVGDVGAVLWEAVAVEVL